ncbi:MAG: hypothetical protein R3348_03510 [Xanthomonadales bacterium]|nr:hypothetical protein [Xanthomonadales bacterium]
MKLLQNNPLGVVLASVCGILVVVGLALAMVWSRPASSGAQGDNAKLPDLDVAGQPAFDIESFSHYKLVTERPLFAESRRPDVILEDMADAEGLGEPGEVADAPDVSLTGVVITGEMRIATMRPNRGGDTLIAIEGEPLGEDYPGWAVTDVKPRRVNMASLDGDSVELELAVNTRTIAEPPKPEPKPEAETAAEAGSGEAAGEDAPLSRAEEIRQRIAQRREELRRQAEENEQDSAERMRSQYQDAIRNMVNRRNDDDDKNEEDGNGN